MNRRTHSIALLAGLSGLAIIAFPFVTAGQPDSDANTELGVHHHPTLEKISIVTGKVASWTTNKGGDVDGFKVGENTVVHFPPHHGQEVSTWLKLEDDVTVFAKLKSRPDGSEVMEAVVMQRGDDAMLVPGPKPRPGQPHHPKPHDRKLGPDNTGDREEQPMSVRGKVTEMHENREGIIDGFKVDAKSEVKFPPHQSEAILLSIRVGDEVVVDGHRHETPKGDIHLHAHRVSSGETVIEVDRPAPKKHERNASHEKPFPKGHDGEKGKGNVQGRPPHVQIVDELRKIRELLQDQGAH